MKTFKQHLNEKWLTSYKDVKLTQDRGIDIYTNPTMAEIKKIDKEGGLIGFIRGFIAPNKGVYISSGSIHPFIMKRLKAEISAKNSIPIIIEYKKNPVPIGFGDYIGETVWTNKHKSAAKIIYDNPWIKRMFKNVEVYNDYGIKVEI